MKLIDLNALVKHYIAKHCQVEIAFLTNRSFKSLKNCLKLWNENQLIELKTLLLKIVRIIDAILKDKNRNKSTT